MHNFDPQQYWKAKGSTYLDNFNGNDNLIRHQEQMVLLYFENNIPRNDVTKVFEVGCGFGRYTKLILQYFPRIVQYWAIDISSDLLKSAKKYVNDKRVTYIEKAIQEFTMGEKHDLVFAGETLFQIPTSNIESVVRKLLSLTTKHFIHIDPERHYKRRELYFYDESGNVRDFAIFHNYESIVKKISSKISQRYTPMENIHQAIYHNIV